MSRLLKTGLIGLAVLVLLSLVLHWTAGVSMVTIAPFYMPFAVLILIGSTRRKK